MSLMAGTAKTDITPPVGTMMGAFPVKRKPFTVPRKAAGVLDPLHARAVALSKGDTDIVICSADLISIRNICLKRIRKRVSKELPQLNTGNILINVSHTHSGPEVSFLHGGDADKEFVHVIERQISETIVKACSDMEPVSMLWGKRSLNLNHNRRVLDENGKARMEMEYDPEKTTGIVDHDLHVIRFNKEDGSPKTILYHYTAHALTIGPKNDKFSADFPGIASAQIEKAFPGCTAQFLNGAAGNIHPHKCMREGVEARDDIGGKVADAVIETAGSADNTEEGTLKIASDTLGFKNRLASSLEVPVEIDVLKIGNFILGFVPGEFFVQHQIKFKEEIKPASGTLVGYANGWPGYVPDANSYKEGGYGVELAEDDPPEYCRTAIPEGAGEQIMKRLLELAKELK